MSILEFPRIYFRGNIAWDPVTTNNYPVTPPPPPDPPAPAAYDENGCDPTLNKVQINASSVAGFRQTAIDQMSNFGSWNPAGSYRSPFYNTYISGVDTGSGLDTSDPFTSAPVSFTGMLVDAEPYGAFSSQLFFDDMSFGIEGGCRIYGKRIERFHDRFINFNANPSNNMIAGIASVMWQTGFGKDQGLQIDAFDSQALQHLQTCLDDQDVLGVMVRFVTYRTVYFDDPTLANGAAAKAYVALQTKFDAGGFQPNPARSLLVGTVGLWRRGEIMTEASDRALVSTMATIPGFPSPNNPPPNSGPAVGTAFARTTDKGIALDFSNTIPCMNRATDKIDIGQLTLTAADPPPAVAIATVATIDIGQYDRAAFEATSGIIDIPLDSGMAKQLANMDLAISGPDGTSYLQESALRAVPAQPNLYINEGETATVTVQVYERGVPAGAGVTVTMSDMNASQATAMRQITDANGLVNFSLLGKGGNILGMVFQPGDNPILPVGNVFSPLSYTYVYLRILPAEANIAALPPTWDNVHNYVLSNWEAMAPCMDNWLRLGDEAQVRAYKSFIKTLTNPANFESFRYMPVTRDLTQGKRTLLYNFLDNAQVSAASFKTAPAEERIDIQKLSRAMRVS